MAYKNYFITNLLPHERQFSTIVIEEDDQHYSPFLSDQKIIHHVDLSSVVKHQNVIEGKMLITPLLVGNEVNKLDNMHD